MVIRWVVCGYILDGVWIKTGWGVDVTLFSLDLPRLSLTDKLQRIQNDDDVWV